MCKVNKGIISHNLVQRKCKDGFGTINSVFYQVWYITILFSFFQLNFQNAKVRRLQRKWRLIFYRRKTGGSGTYGLERN